MAVPRIRTEIENYLVYGIDEKNRRIFFGHPLDHDLAAEEEIDPNEFTDISVEIAVRAIKRMESDHPKKPIEIHLSSAGGDVNAALYLKDIILSSTCQFKFFGGGKVKSSATFIMAVCDERYLYPDTEVLVHDGTNDPPAGTTDQKIDVEENERLQEVLEKIYTENSRMPKDFWAKICKRDTYLTAEEAIFLGLADAIIYPKKRGNFRKIRQKHLGSRVDRRKMKKLVHKIYTRIKEDIKLGDININPPPTEEIDETLVIDNTPVPEIIIEKDNKE